RRSYRTTSTVSTSVSATGFEMSRIAGVDRYATAVEVSRAANSGGVDVVYLATGMSFADALSSAPAAARRGGALLLVPTGSLPAVVADELNRLSPREVVLLGGETVIDAQMPDRGQAALDAPTQVRRLAGVDRYETSRLIA